MDKFTSLLILTALGFLLVSFLIGVYYQHKKPNYEHSHNGIRVGWEDVDSESVLQVLIDYLELEPWWKIEEETGRRIITFRKKKDANIETKKSS